MLDRVLDAEGVARLEGAHCYEVYAGRAAFAALAEDEPGTFYLTDYLARNFERLVIRGLGLDRHAELLPLYFGNYRRLVYLAQADDSALTARAEAAAARLGLAFERRLVGLGELSPSLARFSSGPLVSQARTPRERRSLEPGPASSRPIRASDARTAAARQPISSDARPVVSHAHETGLEEADRGRDGHVVTRIVSGRQRRIAARRRSRVAAGTR
jgi:hypothetical protein